MNVIKNNINMLYSPVTSRKTLSTSLPYAIIHPTNSLTSHLPYFPERSTRLHHTIGGTGLRNSYTLLSSLIKRWNFPKHNYRSVSPVHRASTLLFPALTTSSCMQEWEEGKMQMYVYPSHKTWAISFPSNPSRAPHTQKNHYHTPLQKNTNAHPHVALLLDLSNLGAKLLAEEVNLTLPRLSRVSDRRRSQTQQKPQTITPKLPPKTYDSLQPITDRPQICNLLLTHTPKNPKPDDSPMMTTTTKAKRIVFGRCKTRANPIWCYSSCSSSQECKRYSLLASSIDWWLRLAFKEDANSQTQDVR